MNLTYSMRFNFRLPSISAPRRGTKHSVYETSQNPPIGTDFRRLDLYRFNQYSLCIIITVSMSKKMVPTADICAIHT
jgi:hypothetical protein